LTDPDLIANWVRRDLKWTGSLAAGHPPAASEQVHRAIAHTRSLIARVSPGLDQSG
jgi:hypothetical protein